MKGISKILIFLIILILIILSFYFSKKLQKPPEKLPEEIREEIPKGKMKIISSAFENNQSIPSKYTCDGENLNPPLSFQEIPEGTKSLVLIVDDPDAPGGTFSHWLLWNIDPAKTAISENEVPAGAIEGKNDFGKNSYGGPCPPSGTHRYFFKLYALNKILELSPLAKKEDLEKEMEGAILEKAELIGLYQRK